MYIIRTKNKLNYRTLFFIICRLNMFNYVLSMSPYHRTRDIKIDFYIHLAKLLFLKNNMYTVYHSTSMDCHFCYISFLLHSIRVYLHNSFNFFVLIISSKETYFFMEFKNDFDILCRYNEIGLNS